MSTDWQIHYSELRLEDNHKKPDPPMPYIQDECPCWTEAELDQIAETTTTFCTTSATIAGISGTDGATGGKDNVSVFPVEETTICNYFENSPPTNRVFELDAPEIETCIASIAAECTARGL